MKSVRFLATVLVALFGFLTTCGAGPHLTGVQQADTGNNDHRKYSWRRQIVYLNPKRTPFLQITGKLSTEKVTDYEYRVFERDHPDRWQRLNEALDNSETGVDVDDATPFRVGDVVLVAPTGEMMKVTALPSGVSLTVTRGYSDTTAVAANDNDWVKILFSAEAENGTQASIVTTATTTVTNFAQIFKRSYGISNTRKSMKYRSDAHALAEEKKLAMGLIKEDMEQAFLWGRKAEMKVSGVDTRHTGGIDEFVTTNRVDLEGGIGFGDIGYLMNVFTRFGGDSKIWMCGRDARQQIDGLGLEYRRITGKAAKIGFSVDGIRSSFGDAMLITHLGLTNAHADRIVVLDPAHARIAQLRKMKHNRNIQTPGRDGEEHEFLGELGLWIDTERAHGMVYNVTNQLV
jgi:hypothetical protein